MGTLFGVHQSQDASDADVAVLGIPFDMGYHATRIGSRTGPSHVRNHSMLVREAAAELGIDPIVATGLVDLGDVDVVPGHVESAFPVIEASVAQILRRSASPLTLGGDGSVTLPQLRAARSTFDDLVLLHFDSHTDSYDSTAIEQYNNANTFVHAKTEKLIDVDASFHVGLRDTALGGNSGEVQEARDLGYQVITMSDIESRGVHFHTDLLRQELAGRQIYLCWDMDVFDPSVAPGVVTPAWGGITVREGLQILRGLRGLDVVHFDLNTVSPPHDIFGQTASLAAQVALEFLVIEMYRPKGE
jgi:agmatinase